LQEIERKKLRMVGDGIMLIYPQTCPVVLQLKHVNRLRETDRHENIITHHEKASVIYILTVDHFQITS
jgi:hypothetical protein